jgi:hypothetical protein
MQHAERHASEVSRIPTVVAKHGAAPVIKYTMYLVEKTDWYGDQMCLPVYKLFKR